MFNSKKADPFFVALLNITKNVNEGVRYANDSTLSSPQVLEGVAKRLKQYETDGDTLIHKLIVMLNKSFMTPIEREDILALANKLDDVIDGVEGCVAKFTMYNIIEVTEPMNKFLQHITNATDEMVGAMQLLNNNKLVDMGEHCIKIKDYERQCDEVFHNAMKSLFAHETDLRRIIIFKDLYEQFEETANHCQAVANTIETIIMRNA